MKYIAHINVMPLKELLDPQGKAVSNALHNDFRIVARPRSYPRRNISLTTFLEQLEACPA